jgi:hypothetical protein
MVGLRLLILRLLQLVFLTSYLRLLSLVIRLKNLRRMII